MKPLLTSLLLCLCFSTMAQQSRTSRTRTSIDDDDKTMSIEVEGTVNGKEITYNRRFKVAGMSGAEKEALKSRVFDSLGIGEAPRPPRLPETPELPGTPEPPKPAVASVDSELLLVQLLCETCTGAGNVEILFRSQLHLYHIAASSKCH